MTNGEDDWGVGWGAISFFEGVLSNHTAVDSFKRINGVQFAIIRRGDLSTLNAILVDSYMLGEATVYAILEEFDGVNVVVNNGTWTHVAFDWRVFAKRTGVVVLKMSDFLGAMNVDDLTKYKTRDEREDRRRKRKKRS